MQICITPITFCKEKKLIKNDLNQQKFTYLQIKYDFIYHDVWKNILISRGLSFDVTHFQPKFRVISYKMAFFVNFCDPNHVGNLVTLRIIDLSKQKQKGALFAEKHLFRRKISWKWLSDIVKTLTKKIPTENLKKIAMANRLEAVLIQSEWKIREIKLLIFNDDFT